MVWNIGLILDLCMINFSLEFIFILNLIRSN